MSLISPQPAHLLKAALDSRIFHLLAEHVDVQCNSVLYYPQKCLMDVRGIQGNQEKCKSVNYWYTTGERKAFGRVHMEQD